MGGLTRLYHVKQPLQVVMNNLFGMMHVEYPIITNNHSYILCKTSIKRLIKREVFKSECAYKVPVRTF